MEIPRLLFLLYYGTSVMSVTSGHRLRGSSHHLGSFRDLDTTPPARFQGQKQKHLNTHFQRCHKWSWCDDNLQPVSRYDKRLHHSASSSPPTFMHSSRHRPASLLSDLEIFDFTDSRFIRPPAENVINFPTLRPHDVVVDNDISAVNLIEQYQSFPIDNRVRIFYSWLYLGNLTYINWIQTKLMVVASKLMTY